MFSLLLSFQTFSSPYPAFSQQILTSMFKIKGEIQQMAVPFIKTLQPAFIYTCVLSGEDSVPTPLSLPNSKPEEQINPD